MQHSRHVFGAIAVCLAILCVIAPGICYADSQGEVAGNIDVTVMQSNGGNIYGTASIAATPEPPSGKSGTPRTGDILLLAVLIATSTASTALAVGILAASRRKDGRYE